MQYSLKLYTDIVQKFSSQNFPLIGHLRVSSCIYFQTSKSMDILFDEEEFWGRHKDWLSKQQGVLWATHIDILYFFGFFGENSEHSEEF